MSSLRVIAEKNEDFVCNRASQERAQIKSTRAAAILKETSGAMVTSVKLPLAPPSGDLTSCGLGVNRAIAHSSLAAARISNGLKMAAAATLTIVTAVPKTLCLARSQPQQYDSSVTNTAITLLPANRGCQKNRTHLNKEAPRQR